MVLPSSQGHDEPPLESVIDFSENLPSSEGAIRFPRVASPLHRHQASLEGVTNLSNLAEVSSLVGGIDVTTELPLGAEQRSAATGKFHCIVDYFNTREPDARPYHRAQLIRLTHEYAHTEQSRDILLRAFFRAMALPMDDDDDEVDNFKHLGSEFFGFADFLFDNFFLPGGRPYSDFPTSALS